MSTTCLADIQTIAAIVQMIAALVFLVSVLLQRRTVSWYLSGCCGDGVSAQPG